MNTNAVKYISIAGIVLIILAALLTTGGDGTSIMVVIISSLIFIAASIKAGTIKSDSNREKIK